jgi:hypothetical protein
MFLFSSNRGKPQNQMAQTSLPCGHVTKTSIKIYNAVDGINYNPTVVIEDLARFDLNHAIN